MWSRLAPLLRQAGHDVHTPSLTGIGERSHLASPAVNLSMHITDVLQCLRYERLDVLIDAAARGPEDIANTIVLDRPSFRIGCAGTQERQILRVSNVHGLNPQAQWPSRRRSESAAHAGDGECLAGFDQRGR